MAWWQSVGRWLSLGLFILGGTGLAFGAAAPPPVHAPLPLVRVAGEERVRLTDLARFYGLRLTEGEKQIELSSQWTRFEVQKNGRQAQVNGVVAWLQSGPRLDSRKQWTLARADVEALLDPLLRSTIYLRERGRGLVVLDPGHGGKDPGAIGPKGLEEKAVALDLAKRVRVLLVNQGVRVRLTRDNDRALGLADRVQLAKTWKADLFVSIHLNAASARSVNGLETFIMPTPGWPATNEKGQGPIPVVRALGNEHDAAQAVLGYMLQKHLVSLPGVTDRGLRRARFHVLKDAPCPAALVECGFLSHPAEEQRLRSTDHKQAVARAIARGILEYLAAVQRAQTPRPTPE